MLPKSQGFMMRDYRGFTLKLILYKKTIQRTIINCFIYIYNSNLFESVFSKVKNFQRGKQL
jgi:hypothetical protein